MYVKSEKKLSFVFFTREIYTHYTHSALMNVADLLKIEGKDEGGS